MAEGNVGLPEAAAEPLVGRLSGAAGLVLPGHLQPRGDCAKGAASPERAAAYLRALLLRDAGVFLERHGRLLAREELELFQPLCASSYEVNFYYRLLKQDGERSERTARAEVRNRRLAYYNRHAGRGFFSLEAMRDRDPLLWQHHIGRYQGAGASGPHMPEGGGSMSEMLLQQHDEVQLRLRLHAGAAAEARQAAMVEEETDSDEETEEPGRAAAGGEPSGTAALGNAGGAFGGMDDVQGVDYAPAHASEADRAALQEDFIEEMKMRFLDGGDAGAFDYAAVDSDIGLDEDWAAAEEQDAQDRYFDESD